MRTIVSIIIIGLVSISVYGQDYNEVFLRQDREYDLPKYIVKISPLHFFGNHPFNRYPSVNIGLEQRLKKETTSLYHEIGFLNHIGGINSNEVANNLIDGFIGETWRSDVISNKGLRLREQYRYYIRRREKAFVFFGVEGHYTYQNTEIGEWGFINEVDQWGWEWGAYEKYYTYNRIKKAVGIKPVFGFTYFSKNTEYTSKWNETLNRIVMDLYVGAGVQFITSENKNVPDDVDIISDGYFLLDGFDEGMEGNYFYPAITIGYKIGYIISK